MKAIKITALGAILLCLTLVILAVVTKNPEVRLYDKTVEQLMISEGFSSEQEALANVPHLAEIKGKMNELDNLQYHVSIQSARSRSNKLQSRGAGIGNEDGENPTTQEGSEKRLKTHKYHPGPDNTLIFPPDLLPENMGS